LIERSISGMLNSLPKDNNTTGLIFLIWSDLY